MSLTSEPATVKAPAIIIRPGADCLCESGEGVGGKGGTEGGEGEGGGKLAIRGQGKGSKVATDDLKDVRADHRTGTARWGEGGWANAGLASDPFPWFVAGMRAGESSVGASNWSERRCQTPQHRTRA